MKKALTLIVLAISLASHATVLTVNNNTNLPGNPGQYNTITAAISAASTGDTILVAGSATNYGSVTVSKGVKIFGPGYNPKKQNTLSAEASFTVSISNVLISGFGKSNGTFTSVSINTALSNVRISRCKLYTATVSDTTTNCIIENCYFTYRLDIYNSKDQVNLKISNNIFYTATIYAQIPNALRSGVSIEHNLFIAGTCSNPILSSGIGSTFYNCLNWNISNNIFYNMQGTPSSIVQNNLVYNNNITYSGTTLTSLPPSGSIGSGNLNNTDPLFTSVFTDCTLAPFLLDNLRLKSNSPAKNAGTDGTDIGPTGGSYPIYTATNQFLTGEPPIPQITSLNITGPSSVAVGNGSLQIQVKARKID